MEYINLMMTGNFDEFWFKNMMLACLGHLNIQWDWPRCPSSWHSRHLYPFVMLNFQCLVASSLGQSMPHSCSFKDPMCFPFSNSGYMPAIKIKSLHSSAGSENIWQFCCQNLFHTAITISKTNVGSSTKSSKKQIQWTLWDHVIPSAFYSFHLISFNPNFKRPGPSHHKSGTLNNKYGYHSTSQSKEPLPSPRQSHSQNDPETLPGPRPLLSPASTVAPAEISCSTTAAWPPRAARCSAVWPRAPRMRRGKRGCCIGQNVDRSW